MNIHHPESCGVRFAASRILAAVMLLVASQQALAAIVYTAGANSGSTPQDYFYESQYYSNPAYSSGSQARASSDAGGLRSMLNVKGTEVDNYFTRLRVDDVIFTSSDPEQTMTTVTFSATFSGTASGHAAHAWGSLSLDYVPSTAEFHFPESKSIFTTVSVTTTVPIGVPVIVSATLELKAYAPAFSHTSINFMNSLSFDPNSVFQLEDGVTASSASWGLVDNRLPGVPLPAAVWLFGSGLFGLVTVSGRKKRTDRQGHVRL